MTDRYSLKHVGLHVWITDNDTGTDLTDYACDYHCYPIDKLLKELNRLDAETKSTKRALDEATSASTDSEEYRLQLEF